MSLRSRRFANERLVVLGALAAASMFCLAVELVREQHYGAYGYRFLIWNLFLAWIPLVLALIAYDRYGRGTPIARLLPLGVLWLLFLPNAPYIVTDFVHLSDATSAPLWYDGLELSAFAWTGMLAGLISLYLVHLVARHRYGGAVGWAGVVAVLALVSAGVYLGRVKRWNSWDLLTQPGTKLAEVHTHLLDPSAVGKAFAATVAMTLLLSLAYVVFYLLMRARLEAGKPPSRR